MFSQIFCTAALLSTVSAHGVILHAQGIVGSPSGVAFQVDNALPRNCSTINPCQQDSTIIRDSEITANIVNECGRTELTGNIDVGQNTENMLAAGTVTQVKAGTPVTVTIHQVNADGAGPYFCDLDETSNSAISFTNLSVTNNVPGVNGLSQALAQDFNITVEMPTTMKCTGGSTGNICTVRCRNTSVAGPFGGCFPVQQTDTTATANTVSNIETAQKMPAILAQVVKNQADLADAVAANQDAGTDTAVANLAAVNQLLAISVTSKASPQQTFAVVNDASPAAATTASSAAATATSTKKSSKNKGNNKNN